MALDFVAAQAVARARLLERAVHDPGPWEIEVEGVREPAVKVLTKTRVIFLAHFPAICWKAQPEVAWIYCGGEVLQSVDVVVPFQSAFSVEWAIGLQDADDRIGV